MKKFKIGSIRTRLTIYYSLTIVGISLLIVLLVSRMLTNQFRDRKNELLLEQMQVINQNIEEKMSAYIENASRLKQEDAVKKYLFDGEEEEKVKNLLESEKYMQKGLRSLMLINSEQRLISSFSMTAFIEDDRIIQEGIHKGADNYFSSPHNYPFAQNAADYMDNSMITYCAKIRNEKTYAVEGYLLSNITRDYLFSGQRKYAEQLFDDLYILSADGEFIYRSGEEDSRMESRIRELARKGHPKAEWKSDDRYSYFIRSIEGYPDWIIIGVVSNKSMMHDIYVMQAFICGICILGIGFVVLISHQISKKMTVPIYELSEAMQIFEMGDIPPKVEVEAHDELRDLVSGFNAMIDDIVVFINAVENYGRETAQAEIMALKFQLESLQSQINPHFLYNTLNTVSYLALKGQTENIRRLIQELNALLRSTLSDTEEFICIEEEMAFLRSYIRIQEYRYPGMVETDVVCDEDIRQMLIPKLILQPLVENALLHGIFPSGEKGMVEICLAGRDNSIDISVKDDGVGMSCVNMEEFERERKGFNRIGLKNVNERLEMYYGSEARLRIESATGKGTRVSFTIRKEPVRG